MYVFTRHTGRCLCVPPATLSTLVALVLNQGGVDTCFDTDLKQGTYCHCSHLQTFKVWTVSRNYLPGAGYRFSTHVYPGAEPSSTSMGWTHAYPTQIGLPILYKPQFDYFSEMNTIIHLFIFLFFTITLTNETARRGSSSRQWGCKIWIIIIF